MVVLTFFMIIYEFLKCSTSYGPIYKRLLGQQKLMYLVQN